MSTRRKHWLTAGAILLISSATAALMWVFLAPPVQPHVGPADPTANASPFVPTAQTDRDPLPPHARLRLGSRRFYVPPHPRWVRFSPDHKYLHWGDQNTGLATVSLETGQQTFFSPFYCETNHPVFLNHDSEVAFGDEQGLIHRYNIAAGRQLAVLIPPPKTDNIRVLAVNADESLLAALYFNSLVLFRLHDGTVEKAVAFNTDVGGDVMFSADGKFLVATEAKELLRTTPIVPHIFSVPDLVDQRTLPGYPWLKGGLERTEPAFTIRYSQAETRRFDPATGAEIPLPPKPNLAGNEVTGCKYRVAIEYKPEGAVVRCLDPETGTVAIELSGPAQAKDAALTAIPTPESLAIAWDTGQVDLWRLNPPTPVFSSTLPGKPPFKWNRPLFSPDATRLALFNSTGQLYLLAAVSGRLLQHPTDPLAEGCSFVAFTSTGRTLISRNWQDFGTVAVWNAVTGSKRAHTLDNSGILGLAQRPKPADDVLLLTDENNWLYQMNLDDDQKAADSQFLGHAVYDTAFSADGRYLAATLPKQNTIMVYEPVGKRTVAMVVDAGAATQMQFSPDDSNQLYYLLKGQVKHYDLLHHALVPLRFDCDSLEEFYLSPTGRWFLAYPSDRKGTVQWFDLTDSAGGHDRAMPASECIGVYFYAHDKAAVVRSDTQLSTIDLISDSRTLLDGNKMDRIYGNSVAISPDDHWLVAGTHPGGLLIWNLQTGALHRQVQDIHADAVGGLAFSPDGQTLATGSYDRSILLWDFPALVAGPPNPPDSAAAPASPAR